ncbi:hypothetical protein SFRURICE_015031 [Spodoptera frugiperda]|nr:hypothetical protein SFRURICE_015031 [Spodoptera frugiperda]
MTRRCRPTSPDVSGDTCRSTNVPSGDEAKYFQPKYFCYFNITSLFVFSSPTMQLLLSIMLLVIMAAARPEVYNSTSSLMTKNDVIRLGDIELNKLIPSKKVSEQSSDEKQIFDQRQNVNATYKDTIESVSLLSSRRRRNMKTTRHRKRLIIDKSSSRHRAKPRSIFTTSNKFPCPKDMKRLHGVCVKLIKEPVPENIFYPDIYDY